MLKRFPDGRFCKLCNCQDTDQGPLEGELVFMWWGYPPDKDGVTNGEVCYYGIRVHVGRYKHKMGIQTLIGTVGKYGDEMKKVQGLQEACD